MGQEKKRAFLMMLGGAGLCGAACIAAPAAVITACGVAVKHPLFSVGAALGTHFVVDLFARISDWWGERPDDKKLTTNHDLRGLVILSIEKVIDEVIRSRPSGTQGQKCLERYRASVYTRISEIDDDPRLASMQEQFIVTSYFKKSVKDFASVTSLTPDLWKIFLEPNVSPGARAKHLNDDEQTALDAAACALHEKLPHSLVRVYRNALKHQPAIYVAVMTEIQKEIWNGVTRIEVATQSIRDWQTKFGKVCLDYAQRNKLALQSLLNEQTALAKDARVFLNEIQVRIGLALDFLREIEVTTHTHLILSRDIHKKVANIERDVDALVNQRNDVSLFQDELKHKVKPYLEWLKSRHKIIELRGIKHGNAQVIRLDLAKAYVPLRAKAQDNSAYARYMRYPGPLDLSKHGVADDKSDIPMDKILREGRHLAITGGAGSGKTTVLRSIALRLTTALLDETDLPENKRLGLEHDAVLPVPIFVSLASFARYRRPSVGHKLRDLESFLAHELEDNDAKFKLPAVFFERLLQACDVILLLDGLDEVADDHEREDMRQWLAKFVSDRPVLRSVVTCRTVTYRNDTALTDFREISVQPLDALQPSDMERYIAPMIRGAYEHIEVEQREMQIERLLDSIVKLERERRGRPGHNDKALVDSPLMVRMMLIIQWSNHELPDERAALFDKAIEALFQVEYGIVVVDKMEIAKNWKRYRDMAQLLAFCLHQKGEAQGREIERPELITLWSKEPPFKPHIDDFLTQVHHRGGVVEERGGKFLFMHHAFQEFLVARYLREVMYGEGRQTVLNFLAPLLEEPWWREPILLMASYRTSEAPDEARKLIGALATKGDTPDKKVSAGELAGTAALEWHDSGNELRGDCAQHLVALLSGGDLLANSRPIIRARAGDVLSRLGDPRFCAQRLFLPANDTLGFVRIPEDRDYKIGLRQVDLDRIAKILRCAEEDLSDQINDSLTPTPVFYIARYPVTVSQFRAFVEAEKNFELGDEIALRDPASRPVRYVSWHEALAYCKWLNRQFIWNVALQGTLIGKCIRDGWRVTLPSELEWERASSGGAATLYPWGDRPDTIQANSEDARISDSSTVGCFPANTHGLYDMVGNVFEWTRSRYRSYPYDAGDGREQLAGDYSRVARGGSWYYHRDSSRCAYRLMLPPVIRYHDLGFRIALCSPTVATYRP